MRKYKQLIRLKKWNLDIARRELAELEALRMELAGKIDGLERALVEEQIVASRDGFLSYYGTFAKAEMARRDRFRQSMAEIDRRIAAKMADIQAAFQELKTVEIAAARAAEARLYQQRQADQAVLDDVAGQRAFRARQDKTPSAKGP
ncbi:MAG: hypothetical protein ACOY99_03830 [Pseudomonadota bacterium]